MWHVLFGLLQLIFVVYLICCRQCRFCCALRNTINCSCSYCLCRSCCCFCCCLQKHLMPSCCYQPRTYTHAHTQACLAYKWSGVVFGFWFLVFVFAFVFATANVVVVYACGHLQRLRASISTIANKQQQKQQQHSSRCGAFGANVFDCNYRAVQV